jgi:hypothetical protein
MKQASISGRQKHSIEYFDSFDCVFSRFPIRFYSETRMMNRSLFRLRRLAVVLAWLVMVLSLGVPAYSAEKAAPGIVSHVGARPLPTGHDRPLPVSDTLFADVEKGSDANPGTLEKPLKSVQAAVNLAVAGQTVVLRGGTYYESVLISKAGQADKPITIRAYPKELVTIDAGFPEFYNDPKSAWEPIPPGTAGAVAGEYRSTKTYELAPMQLCANFGDSMLPLIVYRSIKDLRESQMYWTFDAETESGAKSMKSSVEKSIYCGPGVYYDTETKRIHIRMAHTTLNVLGDDNYKGVTDPRQVPLVVGSRSMEPALTISSSAHICIQDIVLRGGGKTPAAVRSSYDVELNGCTLYAGFTALEANFTDKLRVLHTVFRGACSPWNFRGHMKYRSRESQILSASGWAASGVSDLELGYCEFSDSIDGIFIGGVNRVRFHNCLMDNFTDDGIFMSSGTTPDGTTPGGGIELFENRISRVLTVFAFGVGHGRQRTLDDEKKIKQLGNGIFAYRNIFDFRTPVHYNLPTNASEDTELHEHGRMMGDHGSPTWEPVMFYQNSLVYGNSDGRSIYIWSGALGGGTTRRVFNNAFVYANGIPGVTVLRPNGDLQTDYNLTWSMDKAFTGEDPYLKFKKSADYALSKPYYAPGWLAHDIVADPLFKQLSATPGSAFDLSLKPGSPAIGAGVKLPSEWPDPSRPTGDAKPDIGAIQTNAAKWRLGVQGRFDQFGRADGSAGVAWNQGRLQPAAKAVDWAQVIARKPVAIVAGYPDIDRPALTHFLKQNQVIIGRNERTWPDAESLSNYGMIVVVDSGRGMTAPAELSDPLKAYVKQGGKLMVLSGATDQFSKMPGFLTELAGDTGRGAKKSSYELLIKNHPWTKQLDSIAAENWKPKQPRPIPAANGQIIVGDSNRQALLLDTNYGKGRFVYVGWPLCEDLPHATSRNEWANTSAAEADYQAQVNVLKSIVDEFYPKLLTLDAPTALPKPGQGKVSGQ